MNHHPESAYKNADWIVKCDDTEAIVIHTLVVHPNYLKDGVGRSLMSFALKYSREKEMKSIRLDVYEKNIPAIKLYEKCGYTYIGTIDLGLSKYGLDRFRLYELPINEQN